MATMRASAGGLVKPLPARVAAFKPVARAQRSPCVAKAVLRSQEPQKSETKSLQAGPVAAAFGMASLLLAEQAQAASAGSDNRFTILTVIFVPALGWVAFNILGPALNQLANMNSQNKGGKAGARR